MSLKVLAYGYSTDMNFGGASLVTGFREILRRIDPDAEFVYYESVYVNESGWHDADFKVIRYPYSNLVKRFWVDWFKYRVLRLRPKSSETAEFWRDFSEASMVVQLHGICFCSLLAVRKGRCSVRAVVKYISKLFSPNIAARLAGKRSVKATCSFGPVTRRLDVRAAEWCFRFRLFDAIVVRERESAKELSRFLKSGVKVFPDMANLMPVPEVCREDGLIGVVTSFQMERQWKNKETGYIDVMVALIEHIRSKYGWRIRLIPNQDINRNAEVFERNDSAVAHDIYERLACRDGVTVADTAGLSGMERKAEISRCKALVSPRYHACVAALSSGVPVLTIGWHCKYLELAELYGQTEWVMPSDRCSKEALIGKFDLFSERLDEIAIDIMERRKDVFESVVASGRMMLGE